MALSIGQSTSLTVIVGESMTAENHGNPGARVLATPVLAGYFERVAIQLLTADLEDRQGSVGTRLDIRHVAATPVGMKVTFLTTLHEIQGRHLTFHLSATDEVEHISDGYHERSLVDMEKFLSRVERKGKG